MTLRQTQWLQAIRRGCLLEGDGNMRIGILTFFESENYGTVLQAYALQRYLTLQGHETELIRIKREVNAVSRHFAPAEVSYTLPEKLRIKGTVLLHRKDAAEKRAAFASFRARHLSLSQQLCQSDEHLASLLPAYDLFISGGDQIWNPYHKVFSTRYLFDFLPPQARRISYGSSFGVSRIEEPQIRETVRKYLSRYQALSVRESSGVEMLRQMGLAATQVLDPVFLLYGQWQIAPRPCKEKYCLVYSLVDYPKEEDEIIRRFARARGLSVIVLPENRHNCATPYRKAFCAGPEEFLALLAHAEHVFTNSFHGLAFSLMFERQVSLLGSISQDSRSKRTRLTDLLQMFAIEDRTICAEPKEIDYKAVLSVMQEQILRSKRFLDEAQSAAPDTAEK